MNEVEEKFLKEEAEPIFNKYKKEVLLKILENEERFKGQVLEVIENIAKKSKEKEEYKVKYIDFSVLQIGILDETYEVTAIAYDKNWYADEGIWEVFSLDYIFEGLKEIKDKLYKDIKKYVWKIRPCSIDQYILRQIPIFNIYFTYFIINWLKQWDEEISFREMPKLEVFQITWGDYKNYSQKVYNYDSTIKTEEMFKEKMQNGKSEDIVFSTWPSLKADKARIQDKDISCMSLKESELKNILFSSCVALGLNFKKAHLERCHFRNCDLGSSDFTESILDEVIFENCVLRNISFKDTQFKKVYLVNGKKVTNVLKEEDLQCSI
ncbi:hypothetical protein psyc5s11_34040 [Clostridium gelidum]|uniref:Pentapeptide repeat-containing protein n=1 Tax=Clostridium gelidum TaxID=704125 RepID=A0ABN6IZB7_9CLOT|nr:pentapeptide repeat-containing protein [Clostridium gelidum]BCZ47337.1 hypothetical protein psyc5s11_34040 [Clostridium gelidum]